MLDSTHHITAPTCPTTGGTLTAPLRTVLVGAPLTPRDVADVAIRHARVDVAPGVRERLARARSVVDNTLAAGIPTYGLNRGLGPLRNTEIPIDQMADFQTYVIVSHAAAIGTPLSRSEGRAALLARLNTLASGASGASLALFDALFDLLAHDVIPVIPGQGSVGAADLSQMAAIGQVLLGQGRAWLPGIDKVVSGDQALAAAGLRPVVLGPKDSLALVGSNALSVSSASLMQRRARLVAERADLVAALTVEASGSNLSPFDAVMLAARPHPGQIESGARIRAALDGGDLAAGRRLPLSIQDPISIRTVPQVHGALLDQLDAFEQLLCVELDSAPDNPFLDVDAERFVSGGNFSVTGLAIGADAVRIALTHVALLAERRVSLLVKELRQGISLQDQIRSVTAADGYVTPLILAQTASALVAEIKHAATPVSLTGTTVGDGVEDHSSMAYPAVRVTETALDSLERLLAVEALLASSVLALHRRGPAVDIAPTIERLASSITDITRTTQVTGEVVEWVVEALRREGRGDDLSEMRPPAVPSVTANHDLEVARHDQLH